jgi:hypothetical protein
MKAVIFDKHVQQLGRVNKHGHMNIFAFCIHFHKTLRIKKNRNLMRNAVCIHFQKIFGYRAYISLVFDKTCGGISTKNWIPTYYSLQRS